MCALGLRSHEPDEKYWGIDGKLCKNCYASVKSGIQEYDAYYISGYNRLPEEVGGHGIDDSWLRTSRAT